jgi:hypothetical protein
MTAAGPLQQGPAAGLIIFKLIRYQPRQFFVYKKLFPKLALPYPNSYLKTHY